MKKLDSFTKFIKEEENGKYYKLTKKHKNEYYDDVKYLPLYNRH